MTDSLPVVQKAQPVGKIPRKEAWIEEFYCEDLERERLGWEKEITRLTKEKEELKQKIKEQLRELPCLSVIFKTAPACNEKDIPIVCSNCKVRYELLGLSKQ